MPEETAAPGPVVSDTSPLISLTSVGLLHILQELYGEVLIPEAVRNEYESGRRQDEIPLEELSWIGVATPEPPLPLPEPLDAGELAAITLAQRTSARILVLDERLGRRAASRLGLPVVGTLGVLVRAKRAALLPAVGPVLDSLVSHGIRVSPVVRALVLRESDEEP